MASFMWCLFGFTVGFMVGGVFVSCMNVNERFKADHPSEFPSDAAGTNKGEER